MNTVMVNKNKIKPAVVSYIEEGSIGEELGFEIGDKLISINGVKPRDEPIIAPQKIVFLSKSINEHSKDK